MNDNFSNKYLDEALSRQLQVVADMIKVKKAEKAATARERKTRDNSLDALKSKSDKIQHNLNSLRKKARR